MDIKTSFLQTEGFKWDVCMKPPKEARDPTYLWKLLAAAYGLVDRRHLWFRTSDNALVNDYILDKSRYEHTLYFKKQDDELFFILLAQVDNYI